MKAAIALCVLLFSCGVVGADFNINELRPRPYSSSPTMGAEDRESLRAMLEEYAESYLMAVEGVSWKSFESLPASPEVVASLTTEAEDTRTLMRDVVVQLHALKGDINSEERWLLLVRNFYVVAPYMDDLNKHGVVESQDYIGLRLLLPVVMDRILLPGTRVAP